jgi:hypothetical protein
MADKIKGLPMQEAGIVGITGIIVWHFLSIHLARQMRLKGAQ